MLSVDEALAAVGRNAAALPPIPLRLYDLLGLRLAEDVTSDVDSPPFDKSLVDGFAVISSDPARTLRVIELVTAGSVPSRTVEPGATIGIMTGAPLPAGADAVIKWEDCEQRDEHEIVKPSKSIASGAGVLKQGASFHRAEMVLNRGKKIGPLDMALLAEIGRAEALVQPRVRVGVLATGDELVGADKPLGPGQIRNSNGPMLLAAVAAAGATAVDLGVARDDPDDLKAKLRQGLEYDLLLASGGVSAGVKDFVPGILTELGVREVFHQVRVKPGKPLWFGLREADNRRTLVFGLPGNPVSTFVSFKLFVEPALAALSGAPFAAAPTVSAVLATPFKHRGKRPTYQPCRVRNEEANPPGQGGSAAADTGRRVVEPLDWKGSADVATLTRANCLAAMPEGDYELAAGAGVDVLLI